MKVAFAFLAVAFFALAVPHSAQAQAVCTASNYGLFGNDGDQDLLNCNTGTSATASATLSYNGAPACGKLALRQRLLDLRLQHALALGADGQERHVTTGLVHARPQHLLSHEELSQAS
jgi:hypothetical protein